MNGHIMNLEGIVLRSGKGREGGRSLFIFTKENGLTRCTVPRVVWQRYGTGCLLPFAQIRFTAMQFPSYCVMRQYEGTLLLDMMKMTYEEMQPWYYVIELALQLFPQEQSDYRAYQLLETAAMAARHRNIKIAAFVAAVQLLKEAGFDPSRKEIADAMQLSAAAQTLLQAFCRYGWTESFGLPISAAVFQECAAYIDRFIPIYCEVEMMTKGAFSHA